MEKADLTSILKLRENKLHGVLPENIREGCKLQTIDLNGNRIEGVVPRSLANCQDLEVLDVGNNQIVDSFPSWMGTLPNLRILVLRSNQLYGTIRDLHSGYQHFTSLQILDLASNHFSGDLHSKWFDNFISMMNISSDVGQILEHDTNLTWKGVYQDTVIVTFKDAALSITKIQTSFKLIDLSNNSFEGSIPGSIGRLVSLHGLNMSHNNFTGQIPSQLHNLTRLESMDLSCNNSREKFHRSLPL
jgi:Ran GTPase-activating protein (RanGAP) involved in mRNA processing and transport